MKRFFGWILCKCGFHDVALRFNEDGSTRLICLRCDKGGIPGDGWI